MRLKQTIKLLHVLVLAINKATHASNIKELASQIKD